ncbi:hypothetical protein ACFOON_12650 [Novosphingobium piscinae]|uniref:hypothetical protein n=1 Tax=Novosphingobium piscinae TaxID=1507448 RepID=UPI00361F016F
MPPRPDLFTAERQARFLAALAETGAVRQACARVGVSPECVYRLRRRDGLFAAGWDGALVLARRVAEDVLAARALDGVEEPVFFRGEQVGTRVRFDARLLLAHLARLDAHAERSAYGAQRAERFDELLALVGGAAPPAALTPPARSAQPQPTYPGVRPADPQLPPDRAVAVDAALEALPLRAGPRARQRRLAAAEAEWRTWRSTARAAADRLAGPAPESRLRTLSTVSTGALGAGLVASPQRVGSDAG